MERRREVHNMQGPTRASSVAFSNKAVGDTPSSSVLCAITGRAVTLADSGQVDAADTLRQRRP
jgi:hypothetical protein